VTVATALWTRLDTPGHDACRLARSAAGWMLAGTAVFAAQSAPACLHYSVVCDERWHTVEGEVSGWSGSNPISARFTKTHNGSWLMDGQRCDFLADCIDLDFGFTPATNLLQLRRLALDIGERADVDVAWFDVGEGLQRLPQTYERLSRDTYRYRAPSVGYEAELELNALGFVRKYPGLWEEVSRDS
jgi:hypothetical protein